MRERRKASNDRNENKESRNWQPSQAHIKKNMASLPNETEQELIQRQATWVRTRRIGFASFSIPTTIILIMLSRSNEHVRNAIWPLQEGMDGSIMKTAIYFCLWTNIEVVLNIGKYYLCKQAYGMSQEDYRLVIGRRDRWTKDQITKLEAKYGMYNLKQMDAIYRRSGHIIVNMWRVLYFLVICNN